MYIHPQKREKMGLENQAFSTSKPSNVSEGHASKALARKAIQTLMNS